LIHDFTHYVGPASMFVNKIFAIFCNFSIAFPTAHSFGKYHADHHNFLNEEGKDPDLPFVKR
jgi:sphingolipid delta-4 desaturase